MNSITVKVNDLWAVLNLMKKDGMSQVNLTLMEAEDDMPASIWLEAGAKNSDFCVGYDSVDAIPDDQRFI